MIQAAAPWSGHRLILVGDYAHGVPYDVEKDATAEELGIWYGHQNPLYKTVRGCQPLMLIGNEDLFMDYWTRGMIQMNEADANEDQGKDDLKPSKRLLKLIMAETSASFPHGSAQLVLRNLTVKEFVAKKDLDAGGYHLGQAIFVQAQFTNDPSGLQSLDGDTHGAWAGHQIDAATTEDVDEREGWTNVTQQAVELVSAAYDW
ncbi:hypothetical protein PGQ11_004517 [Apiospora arundinis]|uniref:Uncharacterized protein n=1 Tax=Apiospora arundinis TaxID=335852 RepID=A0ABR2J897_9PEZI